MSTVSASDVFPNSKPTQNITGFDLEVWGVPTSQPAVDPHNTKFVYQRFQRGILHYDQTAGSTQGILLAVFIYWGWDTAVSVNEETEDATQTPGRAGREHPRKIVALEERSAIVTSARPGPPRRGKDSKPYDHSR
jgi:hypothetical protein